MVDGIRTGKIDLICSNHNPQDVDTKRLPFAEAADGAVGAGKPAGSQSAAVSHR